MLNLLAFLFPLITFIFYGIIGYAVLSVLRTQRNLLQNCLIAPTVGLAITLLFLFWFSRAGLPVNHFSNNLGAALVIFSVGILCWKKPILPWQRYLPFGYLFLLALFLTGRPLLSFGFNWLSYGNDDMTNYCLGALRLQHYGYSTIPDFKEILAGTDNSLLYWFSVPNMVRSGSELLLAFISSLSHLSPAEIFMPTIVGLHLCLISAGGALLLQRKNWRTISLITCFLLACSPLVSLGTLYQLIAQVGGIAFFIVSAILLLQPFIIHQKYIALRQSILISILLSVLMIYYPEIAPFLFLSLIGYLIINVCNQWKPTRSFILTSIFCFIFLIAFLNIYWINIISFVIQQIIQAKRAMFNELFPYFLIPSGISNLWGIQSIAHSIREPFQSVLILLGLGLLVSSAIIAIKQLRRNIPVIIIMLTFLSILLFLFFVKNGFGVFKTAMYIQPFLLGTLAIGLFIYVPNQIIRVTFLTLFSIMILFVQKKYVQCSYGKIGSSFVELTNASKSHFIEELKQLNNTLPPSQPVSIETQNVVSAKLIALYLKDRPLIYYSKFFFGAYIGNQLARKNNFFLHYFMPDLSSAADQLDEIMKNNRVNRYFLINNSSHPIRIDSFSTPTQPSMHGSTLLLSTPKRTIINSRKFSDSTNTNYVALPWDKASNYIIFINSVMGQDYYLGDNKLISLNNLEQDYFYPHKSMTGIGQYLLFQVINPSSQIRLVLDFTQTFTTNKPNLFPPAEVIGTKHQSFPLMGRGSARVISPPIQPQMIENIPYIMLNMGRFGTSYPVPRAKGMMRLFGNHINLDPRYIVADARAISIISNDEYAHLNPPAMIHKFPEDLSNPDLEYSGSYEDGWISEAAFFNLTQPSNKAKIIIKGDIPIIHDKTFITELTIYVSGKKITSQLLKPGNFDIQIPIVGHSGRQKLELHFSKTQSLPKGDDRTVAAHIQSIGFS
jgi:hypothetical protein